MPVDQSDLTRLWSCVDLAREALPSRVAVLPITAVASGVRVDGPTPEIEGTMRDLHRRRFAASRTR